MAVVELAKPSSLLKNIKSYQKNFEKLLSAWLEKAQEVYLNNESFDLHIHMMSTISDAEDVYKGGSTQYLHKDTMWIWIPDTNQASHHLTGFLNAFKHSPVACENNMQYQILGNSDVNYQSINETLFP